MELSSKNLGGKGSSVGPASLKVPRTGGTIQTDKGAAIASATAPAKTHKRISTLIQTSRDPFPSVSSYESATGETIDSERLTLTDPVLDKLQKVKRELEKMTAATLIQKNINMVIKDGIKIISEATDDAMCEYMKIKVRGTAETDDCQSHKKRKRDKMVSSPELQVAKRKVPLSQKMADTSEWVKVVNKRREKPTQPKLSDTQKEQNKKRSQSAKRQDAVFLIRPTEGRTYADMLKDLRQKVNPDASHTQIRGYRETKDGGLLIKARTNAKNGTAFRSSLQQAVGETGEIKDMSPSVSLEILDLDCATTPDEVKEAVTRSTGQTQGLNVHIFGPNNFGQYMAVCNVDRDKASTLLRTLRIKIGWVNCRIRLRTIVTRCYRCLGYGHTKRECKGTDRSKACWKCGSNNHISKSCNSRPSCFLCSEASCSDVVHVPGSGSCAVFRAALKSRKDGGSTTTGQKK